MICRPPQLAARRPNIRLRPANETCAPLGQLLTRLRKEAVNTPSLRSTLTVSNKSRTFGTVGNELLVGNLSQVTRSEPERLTPQADCHGACATRGGDIGSRHDNSLKRFNSAPSISSDYFRSPHHGNRGASSRKIHI